VKRKATIEGLASEGLAMMLGSAGAGSSAVVGPTPTDPVEFRKCARDLKTLSAAQKHTNEERGGSRDPGVRRPGAGRGQLPARSKIFRAAFICFVDREIEKFIIRQPPKGEKDDYDSENSWISDGLPSNSRRRRREDGR